VSRIVRRLSRVFGAEATSCVFGFPLTLVTSFRVNVAAIFSSLRRQPSRLVAGPAALAKKSLRRANVIGCGEPCALAKYLVDFGFVPADLRHKGRIEYVGWHSRWRAIKESGGSK
jgi:hypothetical protein